MRQLAIALLLGLALMGCRTTKVKPVVLETTKTEYRDRLHLVRDSVYLHDSVFVRTSADTIFVDRWRTRYRERAVHDTVYIAQRDSVSVPVIVEVQKPLSWLRRLELWGYRLGLLALLGYVAWLTIRRLWLNR